MIAAHAARSPPARGVTGDPRRIGESEMFWNHRMVRLIENEDGETLIRFCEVHYNDAREPQGYTDPFMYGNDVDELVQLAARLKEATLLPVLDVTDFVGMPEPQPEPPAKPFNIQDLLCINPIPKQGV